MLSHRALWRRVTAAVAIPALLLGLAACAPEPVAGSRDKGSEVGEDGDGSWGVKTDEDDSALKSAELPEDFPRDAFVVPEGAVIDDAGKRGAQWYLVLRAPDEETAEAWWDEVVSGSGFAVRDESDTDDGGFSATLAGGALEVTAVRLPAQKDGSVLLSYDISSVVV